MEDNEEERNAAPINIDETNLSTMLENIQKSQETILRTLANRVGNTETPSPNKDTQDNYESAASLERRMQNHDEVGIIVKAPSSGNENFITKGELISLLKAEKERLLATSIDFRPPYPVEIAIKPYPRKYVSPVFRKYNGKIGNAKEHIVQFIDDLGIHAHDPELRLREFSKSLTERAYTWYANLPSESIRTWDEMVSQFCAKFYMAEDRLSIVDLTSERQRNGEALTTYVQRFRERALDCEETVPEKELVKLCIKGMFAEYRIYIENHAIYDFAGLLTKARNTEATTSRLTRLNRGQGEASRYNKREGKRGLDIAYAHANKETKSFKKGRREDPPEFPCSMDRVHALLDAWLKEKEIRLPFVEKLPSAEDKQNALYCRFHRRINHSTKDCRTLRQIFQDRLKKGEIIVEPNTVEQAPFPQHRNDGAVMACIEDSELPISENVPSGQLESNNGLIEPLLRTKLFREFFNTLEFEEEARKEAITHMLQVAEKYGPTCCIVSHPIRRLSRASDETFMFTDKDYLTPYYNHNRPLYVEAVINGVSIRRAMIDNGASVNLMTSATLKRLSRGLELMVPQPTNLTAFNAGVVSTLGHVTVELQVGPIKGLTRFHIIDANTSYQLLLGRPWIHTHKCIPSTLHQCIKAYYKGREVTIKGTKAPFNNDEARHASTLLYDEAHDELDFATTNAKALMLPRWEEYEGSDGPEPTQRPQKIQKVALPNGRTAYRL